MQPQPVEQAGMGVGEKRSSMDISSGSTRKTTMNEPDEDQEGHESKRLRLVGGLDVVSAAQWTACTWTWTYAVK